MLKRCLMRMRGWEKAPNKATKLMIHMDTEEEALKGIEILKRGGKVISELAPHPEPDDGGLGGGMPHHTQYREAIVARLSEFSA